MVEVLTTVTQASDEILSDMADRWLKYLLERLLSRKFYNKRPSIEQYRKTIVTSATYIYVHAYVIVTTINYSIYMDLVRLLCRY